MNTEKAKTFALTAFGFLCIAIAVQMFSTPVTSQSSQYPIVSYALDSTNGQHAITNMGDLYLKRSETNWDWVYV